MLVKTSDLSRGERLLVDRRRRAESQVAAAERCGVSLYNYRQWETGDVRAPDEIPLGRLEPFERCVLTRRRDGRTMSSIASALGVCRWWLCQMERGEVDAGRLVSFWQEA